MVSCSTAATVTDFDKEGSFTSEANGPEILSLENHAGQENPGFDGVAEMGRA
jgi:hypothetical protein